MVDVGRFFERGVGIVTEENAQKLFHFVDGVEVVGRQASSEVVVNIFDTLLADLSKIWSLV